jgi:hypothetical protein
MYKTDNLIVSWENKLKTKANRTPVSDFDYRKMICDHKHVEQSKWKMEKSGNMRPEVAVKWCGSSVIIKLKMVKLSAV